MSVQVVNNGGSGWDPFGTLATIAGMATGQPWIGAAYNAAKSAVNGDIGGAIGGLVTGLASNKTNGTNTTTQPATTSAVNFNTLWNQRNPSQLFTDYRNGTL